jgi:hypothetical protein
LCRNVLYHHVKYYFPNICFVNFYNFSILRAYENGGLGEYLVLKDRNEQEIAANCIARSFIIYTSHQILLRWISHGVWDGRSMNNPWKTLEIQTKFQPGNLKDKSPNKTSRRLYILMKLIWDGFSWLRTGSSRSLLLTIVFHKRRGISSPSGGGELHKKYSAPGGSVLHTYRMLGRVTGSATLFWSNLQLPDSRQQWT